VRGDVSQAQDVGPSRQSMFMRYLQIVCLMTMLLGNTAFAADTAPGKILGTQGHINPACEL
jgi:hypothetical protein